jgi:5'-nucleotidase (lipoprotein e(P4) family)
MRKFALLLLFAIACTSATPPAPQSTLPSPPPCNPGLTLVNSTLWVQTGAEFRAAALATFAAATRSLDAALADPSWNVEENGASDPSQPPAIIVDSDDTVFDNSRFQAQMLKLGKTYDQDAWTAWVAEASTDAVPGAAAFLAHAKARGVTVFYVTNREAKEKEGTRQRIANLGFPLDPNVDTVLTRGEKPEWTSDKTSRREFVAANYRLILLAGDDLNDFANARDKSVADRYKIVADHEAWWGTRWFLVPNPMYGSWERAVTGGSGTPCEQVQKKIDALKP